MEKSEVTRWRETKTLEKSPKRNKQKMCWWLIYIYQLSIYPCHSKRCTKRILPVDFLLGNGCCKGISTRYLFFFQNQHVLASLLDSFLRRVGQLASKWNNYNYKIPLTNSRKDQAGWFKQTLQLKRQRLEFQAWKKKNHSILNGYLLSYPQWRFRQLEFAFNKAGCHHEQNVSFGVLPFDLPWSLSNAMVFFPRDPRNRSYLTQPTTYLAIYLCMCMYFWYQDDI